MGVFSAADVCTAPKDNRWIVSKVRRRRLPWSVNVTLTIVMFGVLLITDVIVDVNAATTISSSSRSLSRPTTWLRKFFL